MMDGSKRVKLLPSQKENLYLFLIFAVAFVIRLIHLNSYTSYPAFDLPLGGHAAYVKTALKIISGDILGGKEIFYDNSPIYSYILAGIFKIFGIDFYAVRFLQILIGSINCCLIALISQYCFGMTAALIAGAIAAFYGPFIFYDAEIIVLSWVLFFCLISIVIILRNGIGRGHKLSLAGFFMGCAVMGRPGLILFPALLFLYFIFSENSLKVAQRLRAYAWFCIGVFVIPGLFIARNYAVSGEILFLNPSGGHNFYFGHHKGANPIFNENLNFRGAILLKYREKAEADLKRPLSTREVSNYWYRKGFTFIIENPGEELKLMLKKMLFFFNDTEMPTYFNYYFNRNYSVVLKNWILTFGLIFPLSTLGLVSTLRRGRELMVLHLFFLTSFLSVLIIFVISRVRIPAIPVFIVFAGVGVLTVIEWCKDAKFKPLILAGLFMAPLYWMTFTPLAHLNYADPHNHLGAVYWHKGKIPEAERSFVRALELNQGFEYPLLNLVNMFRQQGDIQKEAMYRNWYEDWKQRYKPNRF